LVIHADPPIEHKAYLHRSGRTARAGAAGTVVTLVTESQRQAVRALWKKAGVSPTGTDVRPGHELLQDLAPGQRPRRRPADIAAALEDAPARGRAGKGSKAGAGKGKPNRSGKPDRAPRSSDGDAGKPRRSSPAEWDRPSGARTGKGSEGRGNSTTGAATQS